VKDQIIVKNAFYYTSISTVKKTQNCNTPALTPPTLYVLNAAAITKPHAVQHLTAELVTYQVDIAVIIETHLKSKHRDKLFAVNLRCNCTGRRGGGVAVYRTSIVEH